MIGERLGRCAGFRRISDVQLSELVAAGAPVHHEPGAVLLSVGQPVPAVHLISEGHFRVLDHRGEQLALLRPGDLLGDVNLLLPGPATATVIAGTGGQTFAIDHDVARAAILGSAAATLDLAQLAIERTRRSQLGAMRRPLTFAITGDRQHAPSVAAVVSAVEQAGVERVGDPNEHVDVAVVVGSPQPRAGRAIRTVQLHDRGSLPVHDALHLRLPDDPSEIARASRIIAGGARIAVFSGGGARAAAHIGIVDELRTAGIEFDAAIGVSAGCIAALGVGYDLSTDTVVAMGRDWAANVSYARDLGPTGQGLLTGKSFTASCRQEAGERRLEHVQRPCLLVATDAESQRPFVFSAGPAWKALRASASLPGVFPPVRHEGRLLVDGGVSGNLPTGLAHGWFPDPEVYAVDVGSLGRLPVGRFSESGVANRRQIGSESSLLVELMTSLVTQPDRAHECTHLFEPDVAGISTLGRTGYDTAVLAGRREARAWLGETGRVERSG